MKTIATLGPSVRLVVFQFLIKSTQVPVVISPKRPSAAPPVPPVSGVKILESTPGVDLFPLAAKIVSSENYELVAIWKKGHETDWRLSFVRFVFCHKEHVKQDELFPEFVAKRDELANIITDLVAGNLWATQVYLNPYFEGINPTGHQVMMFGCAGRIPNTEVFQGGRDENNRGVGPKVLLSTLSPQINLTGDGKIFLTVPNPMIMASAV